MIIDRKWLAVPCTLLLAAGCTPNDITLGAAVRNNKEAQIVEPDPQYSDAQTADGSQVAGAQARYRTDRVKKARTIRTTTGTSGSGSSSGGGN
jgi:hypothetical protein